MTKQIARVAALGVLLLGAPASVALAQTRWNVEGLAGLQLHYKGGVQSLALGFNPTRSLTLFAQVERSNVDDRMRQYADGDSAERGSADRFVGGGIRYAFFTRRSVSPYVLIGGGRGTSRPNVSERFPDIRERDIAVVFYGAGARIPIRPWLDAVIDTRLVMAGEAVSDYFGVRMAARGGLAVRF
jgi:hypothetical protein